MSKFNTICKEAFVPTKYVASGMLSKPALHNACSWPLAAKFCWRPQVVMPGYISGLSLSWSAVVMRQLISAFTPTYLVHRDGEQIAIRHLVPIPSLGVHRLGLLCSGARCPSVQIIPVRERNHGEHAKVGLLSTSL